MKATIFFLILVFGQLAFSAKTCHSVSSSKFVSQAQAAKHFSGIVEALKAAYDANSGANKIFEIYSSIELFQDFLDIEDFRRWANVGKSQGDFFTRRSFEAIVQDFDRDLRVAIVRYLKRHPNKIDQFKKLKSLYPYQKARILDSLEIKRERPLDRTPTPMEQNLIWETEENTRGHARSSSPVEFELKLVSLDKVSILESSRTPSWIRELLVLQNGNVLIPMSPFNNSDFVPFQSEKTEHIVEGFPTGSRTTYFKSQDRYLAIKIPSNYTNPSQIWEDKARLQGQDIHVSLEVSKEIAEIDSIIGPDPRLIVLLDVMAIIDKATQNGVAIRDITPLMDGHYYMPSFTVQKFFAEKKISEEQAREYDRIQARGYALFLIRYGYHLQHPHLQNSLVQLLEATGFKTTGAFVIRDVGDTDRHSYIRDIIQGRKLRKREEYFDWQGKIWEGRPGASISSHDADDTFRRTIIEEVGFDINDSEFPDALRAYHKRLAEKHRKRIKSDLKSK